MRDLMRPGWREDEFTSTDEGHPGKLRDQVSDAAVYAPTTVKMVDDMLRKRKEETEYTQPADWDARRAKIRADAAAGAAKIRAERQAQKEASTATGQSAGGPVQLE